jgi:hypothetical protein
MLSPSSGSKWSIINEAASETSATLHISARCKDRKLTLFLLSIIENVRKSLESVM